MKDSEFIELLNLYLDHEISAADAVRLEAEVQGNSARRRIYEDYCRMQKACKVLAVDFQVEAPDRKVVPFEPAAEAAPRPAARASGFYTLGTLAAAAACVAVILVSRNSNQDQAGAAAGLAQTAPAVVQQAVATTATPAKAAPSAVRAPSGMPLFLSGQARNDALNVAVNEEANARFAWMSDVQLAPIQIQTSSESLRFDAQPQKTQPGVYSSPEPLDVDVHMAAFRFQK